MATHTASTKAMDIIGVVAAGVVKGLVGPGDDPRPVLTIMLEDED
jgi:hypothetical protein